MYLTSIQPLARHLSYFGDPEFIKNKLQNFAHTELNTIETIHKNNIQRRIDETECLFGNNSKMLRIPITENPYLPPQYTEYLKQFI